MKTSSTTSTAQQAQQNPKTTVTNPNAKLDSKDFMKLLLTQLRYQDPTAPMDSEKMLSQTSQLATLETQESTNKIMKELAAQLKAQSENGMSSQAISTIGKIATIGDVSLAVTKDALSSKFDIFFPEKIDNGKVTIKNKNGDVVKTFDLKKDGQGVLTFDWNLKDEQGGRVTNGSYSVSATYKDAKGIEHTVKPGTYPVESVKFDKGKTMLKLGSTYVPMNDIKEIKQG